MLLASETRCIPWLTSCVLAGIVTLPGLEQCTRSLEAAGEDRHPVTLDPPAGHKGGGNIEKVGEGLGPDNAGLPEQRIIGAVCASQGVGMGRCRADAKFRPPSLVDHDELAEFGSPASRLAERIGSARPSL